jgi:hypothetical protein
VHEAVTVPRHRLDVEVVALAAERLAQRRDVVREVALLDDRVGPHRCDQLVARQQPSRAPHQDDEGVEDLGAQRDGQAVAGEEPLRDVEPVRPEGVDLR